MRKITTVFLIIFFFCALLSSCASMANDTESSQSIAQEWMHTACSKEGVKAFMAILGTIKGEGLLSGNHFDEEHCYNVTPSTVSANTDIRIFKFSDTCLSLALIDGEVYQLCNFFGGHGFFNAVPWDYDADGTMDLLVASSWGSGFHRSEISVFNVKTKQSTVICSSILMENADVDWFVEIVSPSSDKYYENSEADPFSYCVYSAEVECGDRAELSYLPNAYVGSIDLEDGAPVFHPCEAGEE